MHQVTAEQIIEHRRAYRRSYEAQRREDAQIVVNERWALDLIPV